VIGILYNARATSILRWFGHIQSRRLGVAPVEEKLVQHRLRWFGHIQQRLAETPVCSGVIRRSGNEKRGR
jgi:hypothetical protein